MQSHENAGNIKRFLNMQNQILIQIQTGNDLFLEVFAGVAATFLAPWFQVHSMRFFLHIILYHPVPMNAAGITVA